MQIRKTKSPFAKKALSLFLTTALLVTIFIPMPMPAEAKIGPAAPTPVDRYSVVDGDIIPAARIGDTSDWVELARSGGYSLIVRKNVLPLGQVVFDTRNISAYNISSVRDLVNNWFKNTLPKNARVRDYVSMSNAVDMKVAGSLGYFANITAGYSVPSGVNVRSGDDVAFLLSFAEAAMFCSRQYATSTTTYTTSPALAIKNFTKLTPPGPEVHMKDFWWLRSEGHLAGSTKNACSVGTHATPMTGCVYASSSQAAYPYVRPAMWVNSGVKVTTGTVRVDHIDILTGEKLIPTEVFVEVPEGAYGPYLPKDFRFYLPGELASGSDPASGTLLGGDIVEITYLYMRGSAKISIVNWNLWDDERITQTDFIVFAGEYGPYEPEELYGFGPGEWMPWSDPPEGEIDIDQEITIVFGYYRDLVTIVVIHELVPSGYEIYSDAFAEALGHYGPYLPLTSPFFEFIGLDPSSDPEEGVTTVIGTVVTIKFLYRLI